MLETHLVIIPDFGKSLKTTLDPKRKEIEIRRGSGKCPKKAIKTYRATEQAVRSLYNPAGIRWLDLTARVLGFAWKTYF